LEYWPRHPGRQKEQGWGAKIVDRLAEDLRREFTEVTGFSPPNLKYMRAFAEAWPDERIVQAPLAQITWYHNIALIEKLQGMEEKLWYAQQTIQNGWSRNVLVHQIESDLYRRQGKALTNFTNTLPAPQSELAQQIVKDPQQL
jgi:predicted nuclease of restriction endonuclease-like (RecB) superfamily